MSLWLNALCVGSYARLLESYYCGWGWSRLLDRSNSLSFTCLVHWFHFAAQLLYILGKLAMLACIVNQTTDIFLIAFATKSNLCAFLIFPGLLFVLFVDLGSTVGTFVRPDNRSANLTSRRLLLHSCNDTGSHRQIIFALILAVDEACKTRCMCLV